jgi:hypothetical protein
MTEPLPSAGRYGDGCDWCHAPARPVDLRGVVVLRIEHVADCATVAPLPWPPPR